MFRVLLPVDSGIQRAEKAAETLAETPCVESEYKVAILNVFQELKVADDSGGKYDSEEYYDEDAHPDSVEQAAEILESRGVTVSKHRRHGEPSDEILEFADEFGADRIVMTGHKQTPIGKLVFGSVAQQVLLNANIPVTIAIN